MTVNGRVVNSVTVMNSGAFRMARNICGPDHDSRLEIYRLKSPRHNEQGDQLSRRWSCFSRWLVISAQTILALRLPSQSESAVRTIKQELAIRKGALRRLATTLTAACPGFVLVRRMQHRPSTLRRLEREALENVALLLKTGASVNAQDQGETTALMNALVAHGVDLNARGTGSVALAGARCPYSAAW